MAHINALSRAEKQYQGFLNKWKEIALLSHTAGVLGWDQRVMMPNGEGETRAEQSALIANLIHERMTDDRLWNILSDLAVLNFNGQLNNFQSANVREAFKIIKYARALPTDLVSALAKETSLASEIWQKARKENSFKDFAPSLKTIVKLSREKAAAYMAAGIGTSPYEALFFEYENGITLNEVDAIFNKLRAGLPPLVEKIMSLEPPNDSFLFKHYPKDLQERTSREIITAMDIDWSRCRLDVSTHPFTCSPAYASPRITSRYDENNLTDAIFSAIHEAGHAIYEQGLPADWAYQPIGTARGLSVHESQSRFWDAWLGREFSFWLVFYPKLQADFPEQLNGVSDKDFYRALNGAKQGFIRVDSDLLTYNLHILLRYDIEKTMMDERMSVDDFINILPHIWNGKFLNYFGINVPDDRRGILQDVHWSDGSFGYFPTYTLGNIISAQLYEKMKNDIPWSSMWDNGGSCHAIRKWLWEKIHRHGSLYETQELVKLATGQPISVDVFMTELKKRYSDVYNINLS